MQFWWHQPKPRNMSFTSLKRPKFFHVKFKCQILGFTTGVISCDNGCTILYSIGNSDYVVKHIFSQVKMHMVNCDSWFWWHLPKPLNNIVSKKQFLASGLCLENYYQ
jgi:hypothetical protein